MSFIAVPRPRHASEHAAFDQCVEMLWTLSGIIFEVFGIFFWAALGLFYLKAIS